MVGLMVGQCTKMAAKDALLRVAFRNLRRNHDRSPVERVRVMALTSGMPRSGLSVAFGGETVQSAQRFWPILQKCFHEPGP